MSLTRMLKSLLEMNSGELCCLLEQAKINVLKPVSFLFTVQSQHVIKENLYVQAPPKALCNHFKSTSTGVPQVHASVLHLYTCLLGEFEKRTLSHSFTHTILHEKGPHYLALLAKNSLCSPLLEIFLPQFPKCCTPS